MLEPLFVSCLIILSSFLFQLRRLNIKKLQEKGLSPLTALYYQKYAIYPAFILLFLTFEIEYCYLLLTSEILITFGLIAFFWFSAELIGFYLLKAAKSLSFLNAFQTLIAIPAALAFGYFLNQDVPNYLIYLALLILIFAVIIKPQSKLPQNQNNIFQQGFFFILLLAGISVLFDVIDNGLYRFILQNFQATIFGIAFYTSLTMLSVNIFFLFKKIPLQEKKLANQSQYLAFSIAPFWFLASIPEGYGFSNVPIYTYVGIAAATFLLDVSSDLKNNRIANHRKTYFFATLVVASLVLSTFSLA